MTLIRILGINQDIVQIYKDKDIKFFSRNFFNVTLKDDRSIKVAKRRNLALKVAIPSLKSRFPYVFLLNLHLVIRVYQIQLDEAFGTAQTIKQLANQRQRISIFDGQVIETLIVNT